MRLGVFVCFFVCCKSLYLKVSVVLVLHKLCVFFALVSLLFKDFGKYLKDNFFKTTLMVFLPLRNNTGHVYYIEVRKRGHVWFLFFETENYLYSLSY